MAIRPGKPELSLVLDLGPGVPKNVNVDKIIPVFRDVWEPYIRINYNYNTLPAYNVCIS